MKASTLWIDDQLNESVHFRSCLIGQGVNVTIAPSFAEAIHHISSQRFDAIYMQPELKLEGFNSVDLDEFTNRSKVVPYAKDLVDKVRENNLNSKTPIYLFSFHSPNSKLGREIISRLNDEKIQFKEQRLTSMIYLDSITPNLFGWNAYGAILDREKNIYERSRADSRVEG